MNHRLVKAGGAAPVAEHRGRVRRHIRRFVHYWRIYGPKEAFHGVKAVLLGPLSVWVDRRFDRRYRIDTTTTISLAALTIRSYEFDHKIDVRRYQATPLLAFRQAMSVLPRDLSRFSFVDFGSGKGRVLLLASSYGFRRLVGIEFSDELHEIACQNLTRYSNAQRRSLPVELINDNVINYEIPDEPCVFYFYNPFADDVMSAVLNKVAESYHAHPRKLYFIYINPRLSDAFERLGFVRAIRRGRFGALSGVVYETVPEAHSGAPPA